MNSPEKFSIECVDDFVYLISHEYRQALSLGKQVKLLDLREMVDQDQKLARETIDNFVKLFKLKVHY